MNDKQLFHHRFLISLLAVLITLMGCQGLNQEMEIQDEEIAVMITPKSTALVDRTATEETQMADPTHAIEMSATPSTTDQPTGQTVTQESDDNIDQGNEADADVEYVRVVQSVDGSWTFHVTVRHPDTGWEDYANGWDVVTEDGSVLKRDSADEFTRLLLHPHENEQPFTRSQSGLAIPEGVSIVIVRAHDIIDGYGGREVVIDLNKVSGLDYEVDHQ